MDSCHEHRSPFRGWRVAPLFLLALDAVLFHPFAVQSHEADIAAVTSFQGHAVVHRAGLVRSEQVKKGAGLKVGDEVRTGQDGLCQLTLTDDSFINLGPRSSARVNQYSFDEQTGRRSAVLQIQEGSARIVVYKLRSNDSKFRIEADPASVFIDDLADIVVTVSGSGTVAAALQGVARVRNRLSYVVGEVRLRENLRTSVALNGPPTAPMVVTRQERQELLKIWKGL